MTLNLNNIFLIFGNIGGTEILVIVLLALLMFGGKKIPELMRGMGRGIREFNDAKNNVKNELEESIKEKEAKQEAAQKQTVAQ